MLPRHPLFAYRDWLQEPGVVVTAEDQAGDLSPAGITSHSPQDFWRSARAAEAGVTKAVDFDLTAPRPIRLVVARWDRESIVPAPSDLVSLRLGATAGSVREEAGNKLSAPSALDDPAWALFQATVSADATTAPDGSTTADKLVGGVPIPEGETIAQQSIDLVEGISYRLAFAAKAAEYDALGLGVSGAAGASQFFDLTAGETLGGTGGVATITALADDWWACALTFTATGDEGAAYVVLKDGSGGAVEQGDGLYLADASLEAQVDPPLYETGALVCDVDPLRGLWVLLLEEEVTARYGRLILSFAAEREAELGGLIVADYHQMGRGVAWGDALTLGDNGEVRYGPSGRAEARPGKAFWTMDVMLPRLDEADRRAWEEADYHAKRTGQIVFVADPSDPNRSTIVGCRPEGAGPTVRRNLAFAERALRIRENV
ncbi:MAG: hypothetical protein WD341_06030 [Tistlia sp.]|uniref:phage head spike fiber domain-containing protein n=1 Tax=Tistlia sp. TaxID=3057121 RepID=UPI0034A547EF